MRKRNIGVAVLTAATAAATAAAAAMGMNPPTGNVAGAFVSIAVLVAAAKFFKVDDTLFFCGLVFVFMAAPVGSVINLYRTCGPYDKIIHLMSGILLAALGMLIIRRLMEKAYPEGDLKPFALPMLFAACMFSGAGAGIWEMFEFLADRIAGGQMQRGMVDTVTDIIAGNAGALVYAAAFLIKLKKDRCKKKTCFQAKRPDIKNTEKEA